MAYTTINKSTDYFNTKLYSGSNSTQSITGVGFQPDWVWIKNRSSTPDHMLNDAVRTAGKQINSNTTSAELDRTYFQSFNSDGFSLDGNVSDYNQSGSSFVSWNWLANGSGSANTDGSINSTVSVNTTAGFSIVKWTGSGANATVGHGLGVAPKMIILKNTSEVYGWQVYHASLGNTKYVSLNSTDAEATSSQSWNNTSPTSTVFSVGASDSNNKSGNTIIAYCFAEKQGYSKFGSYIGNGNADGPFIFTGFKPAYLLTKNTSGANNWTVCDNKRNTFNPANTVLNPNTSTAETTNNSQDLLSNGVKNRSTETNTNQSGSTYIYMAFAEAPLVGTNNIPATGR